jgi:serine/threonine protein kinase
MSQRYKRKRDYVDNASEASVSERLVKIQGPEISFQPSGSVSNKEPKGPKSGNPITSPFGRCSDVSSRYKKLCRIGQGTYGIVYKALDLVTSRKVALKRCLPHNEKSDGFPITTLREIQTLREISHKNIVQLIEIAVSSKQSGVFLVFEYLHFDLANVIDEHYAKRKKSPFTIPEIKCLSVQLLSALEYLHRRCIVHR